MAYLDYLPEAVGRVLQQTRAEWQLREQAALLDEAGDAILVCDREDCIVYWNRGAERLYGWPREEALDREVAALLFPGRSPELAEARRLLLETGAWSGELRQMTRAGAEVVVESRWFLVRDEQGQPRTSLMLNTDVTEKRRLQEQALRAQRLESIGTLAGGIAHDLNNALTPISMAIELLRTPQPEEQRQALLSVLESSTARGTELVRQVLAFARGSGGRRARCSSGTCSATWSGCCGRPCPSRW